MSQADRYVRYYLEQQQGNGITPVFSGSPWQKGYGQIGYGLGGLFRSLARTVMPMVKSGAKTLGKIALNTGANVLGDVLAGKNLKEAARSRINEAAGVVRKKAVNKLQTLGQTGRGRKTTPRKTGKKRKRPTSTVRSTQSKKRKTFPAQDIFG